MVLFLVDLGKTGKGYFKSECGFKLTAFEMTIGDTMWRWAPDNQKWTSRTWTPFEVI